MLAGLVQMAAASERRRSLAEGSPYPGPASSGAPDHYADLLEALVWDTLSIVSTGGIVMMIAGG
jgi:hypothetical protein